MPRHAVGRGGVETITGEKFPGFALRHNAAIKEQTTFMGIFGAKRHIMAHHQNGNALGNQSAQDQRKGRLELCVKTFGRLVQQENVRCS